MVCVSCGTEIAEKAIVCYRCGTPTAIPAPRVPPPPARSGSPWTLVLGALGVALGAAAGVLPDTSAWDTPAAAGAGAALALAVGVWWRAVGRRGR